MLLKVPIDKYFEGHTAPSAEILIVNTVEDSRISLSLSHQNYLQMPIAT